MNVLYIAEDYVNTKVHHNLCKKTAEHLDRESSIQVYCLSRESMEKYISKLHEGDNYKVYVNSFRGSKLLYKYFFPYKVKIKENDLKHTIDLTRIDIIHAATLFSEGAIAYRIYKKFGIPYIIAVRGTDINFYLKRMPHLWPLGKKILLNAKKVVFITEQFRSCFSKLQPIKEIYSYLDTSVIPNGIDDFWHKHRKEKKTGGNPSNLLYIGRFDNNKNVVRVLDAILLLKDKYPNLKLKLVGGGGPCHESVIKYCKEYPKLFEFFGKVNDMRNLAAIMTESDIFIMVSHSETFGLVYIEALSQGLPIIYTKNQGIDGCFDEKIGEATSSGDVNSIAYCIETVLNNYDKYVVPEAINKFSWADIARKYIEEYNKILTKY